MHKNRKFPNRPYNQPKVKKTSKIKGSTHTVSRSLTLTPQMKKIFFAIGSSLIIGIIFGFITLKMVKQEDPENKSILHSAAQETTENNDGNTSMATFDSLNTYVVQGGVFREKENADKSAQSFHALDFSAVSWERGSDYYLLAGIYASEENAKLSADEMTKENLDVYVKEWEIKGGQINVNEADKDWLARFLELWKSSLESLENNKGLSIEKWDQLLNNSNGLSAKTLNFAEEVQGYREQLDQQQPNDRKERDFLLKTIQKYENLTEK
ncbi:SPOR domain-containing protein [Pseudogracilibacillus sp. SO30301A]|uniref:SPOR domain-containing protein n=1 Tax=Pseudogracilibacillus sp. SO30301A TaxID=3098291 RepID=UPI00300DDE2B